MSDRPDPATSDSATSDPAASDEASPDEREQTNRQQIGGHDHRTSADKAAADARIDHEVELITQTIQPHSDAPSRSGITGSGSGADGER